jgi:hypothetical protein
MKLGCAIACAAAAAAAGGLAVGLGPAAGAAPHAKPPSPAHRKVAPKPNTRSHAAARHRVAVPAVARVPHLDPRLQTPAGPAQRNVSVAVRGDGPSIEAAVQKVHGRTLAATSDAVSAVVPRAVLATLARSPGVTSVNQSIRAVVTSVSEGVGQSGAAAWHSATPSLTGSGVKVAVVDGGFANLTNEVSAGNLPAGTTINGDYCADNSTTQHGTAVAEIVHQMAPAARLLLYCIDDTIGFKTAEQALQAAGVKIVNSSLGFPGDSRGDGTGDADSAAATVRTARQTGILWIESAGNNGTDHWSGVLKDTDHDGLVDLDGTANEFDGVLVPPAESALLVLQWDQWPTSSAPVSYLAYGWQCHDDPCNPGDETPINPDSNGDPTPVQVAHPSGTSPVDTISLTNGDTTYDQEWDIAVDIGTGTPAVRYDLSYWGSVSGSYLASGVDAAHAVKAATSSITEPASSPYALAVGAADVVSHVLEPFSSQGPTIDGRTKPDITGFDGVSSNLPEFGVRNTSTGTGFYGTSAAAPHVAGAAVLVSEANPGMDAAQIQDFLERRAGTSPASNQTGHGLLTLGATSGVAPPATSGYAGLPVPQRILDTRSGTSANGRVGVLGAKEAIAVAVPGLPADATAVAINLTGTAARQPTFLAAYPGSTWPGTANLNVSSTDSTATVLAVVTLAAGDTITVRNDTGSVHAIVDLVGYFAPSAAGRYAATTAQRIVDTRNGTGGYTGTFADHQAQRFTLPPGSGVPSGATAVVVDVTATGQPAAGYVALSTTCSGTTSTLSYLKGYTRGNLAVAPLDGSGSFCVFNSGGPVNVIVDLVGWIGPAGTTSYVALPVPVRISDTRYGNGGHLGALAAHDAEALQGAGIFDVPYPAAALLANVTATGATASTFITAYPGATRPFVSTLSVTTGRTVPNAAVINLSSGAATVYNDQGNVQAIVDLFGYFV